MKNLIYLLGLGALGYVIYNVVSGKSSSQSIITDPPTNSYLQTQPQQFAPMQMIDTPRVDNADQPWYGGSRDFMGMVESAAAGLGVSYDGDYLNYNTDKMWTELSQTYN